ncbi:hypothetical protein [Palleronia sp. LCG004]|uniref:hypothetical protein n=1 Tax=Palleronia sp. LCG004 TaxID=3079304 RepID=UPI00294359F9|nr:hypothetical protein [Palleronia sp. LCG004]WOI55865.1 hypothetical protein RVY76_12605 [Palleronia sp. LCG004]
MGYGATHILDPGAWAHNMDYVLSVIGTARTTDDALRAYLDDRRRKGMSILEAFGLFGQIYREMSGPGSTIDMAIDPSAEIADPEEAGGGLGSPDSDLGALMVIMEAMHGSEGTTSPCRGPGG